MATHLDELRARIRRLGRESELRYDVDDWDNGWSLEVDGQVIATGGCLGELEEGIEAWLAAQEVPS